MDSVCSLTLVRSVLHHHVCDRLTNRGESELSNDVLLISIAHYELWMRWECQPLQRCESSRQREGLCAGISETSSLPWLLHTNTDVCTQTSQVSREIVKSTTRRALVVFGYATCASYEAFLIHTDLYIITVMSRLQHWIGLILVIITDWMTACFALRIVWHFKGILGHVVTKCQCDFILIFQYNDAGYFQ